MAEEQGSRRRRRPPRASSDAYQDPTTEEEFPAVGKGADREEESTQDHNPIQQELSRRGLAPEPNFDAGEDANVGDLSEDSALVFDAEDSGVLNDAAATFVGELPLEDEPQPGAAPVEKTEILQIAGPKEADFPVLTIETADGQSSDVEVVKDRFVLGRSPDSDVVIPDSLISRHHVTIEKRPDGWYVVDQNSGNGTFLNDERIQQELLYDGDVLQLGDAFVTFTAPGGPAEQAPRLDATQMLQAAEVGAVREGTNVTGTLSAGPARRKRKKLLLIAGIVVVLLAIGGVAKNLTTQPKPTGPTPAQLEAQRRNDAVAAARTQFEQVKELVKQSKWKEAVGPIREIAAVLNSDPTVNDYKASIERESTALEALDKARDLFEKQQFDAAVVALNEMPPESMQARAAEELKKNIDETRLGGQLEQARTAMLDKRWDDAIAVADQVLQAFPDNQAAAEIKRKADEERTRRAVAVVHRKKRRQNEVPKEAPKPKHLLMGKALDLYRADQVDQALAQASGAGVSADGVKTLRRFQTFYKQGQDMARNPGQAANAIKYLVKAVELDKSLSGGSGALSENLRKTTAKAYFLQGVDAHTRGKYPLAYSSFTSSLKYNPGLEQSRKRIRDLEQEAKKFFETAYVIKGSSPEKAVSHCQTVMGMVDKSNVYYTKCKKMIDKIRGPTDSSGEGEGF